MASEQKRILSLATRIYVLGVFCLGAGVIYLSIREVNQHPVDWQWPWIRLAGLTLISGWLSVKLPSGRASISISETFVLAGTVLFGAGVGAILVALDAAVLCTKEYLLGRAQRREVIAFNIVAPAISIWLAAITAGLAQPAISAGLSPEFVLKLATFTALYFIL